jgi:hypothetical protein
MGSGSTDLLDLPRPDEASARAAASRRPSARTLTLAAAGLVIFLLAVVPRTIAVDRNITADEPLWIERSSHFIHQLAHGHIGSSVETGHPGVTTMWVAGLAQHTLPPHADTRARFARARVWLAGADALLIVAAAWLAMGLFGVLAGFLTGLVLALDPFLAGHNRVVHLDGFLALFMLLSFLAALRYARDGNRRMLIVSGVFGGLSVLTKVPGMFVLIAVALLLWRAGARREDRKPLHELVTWMIAAGVTMLVLDPAMIFSPFHQIALLIHGGTSATLEGHEATSFFLGRVVANQDLRYYPLVILLRTTPLTLIGALLGLTWAVRYRLQARARDLIRLALFALGYLVLMSIALKKTDRYIILVFVAIDVVAAVWLARVITALRARRAAVAAAVATVALALHGVPAFAAAPYTLEHYNLLTGGGTVAKNLVVVGWGDGTDEAAEYLNALPGARTTTVATTGKQLFAPFYSGTTVAPNQSAAKHARYFVFGYTSIQAGRFAKEWARFEHQTPFWTLSASGIPLVRIYRTGA